MERFHVSRGTVLLRMEESVGVGRSNEHPIKCGRTSEREQVMRMRKHRRDATSKNKTERENKENNGRIRRRKGDDER